MDIWTATRTILEKSPEGIRSKELIVKLTEKTGLSRSAIFDHLSHMETTGKLYREKGKYWLEKCSREHPSIEEILRPFQQIPRDPLLCSLAIERLKREYPDYYQGCSKEFSDLKQMNYGYSGFITNPSASSKISRNRN